MLRIEQLRSEMLDRFERVDRRLAQQDQRLGRIDQRSADAADRLEVVRLELLERLEAIQRLAADSRLTTVTDD
jgi:hypothetical protein